MIVRRCSQGHRIRIHINNSPGTTRVKTWANGDKETLTYPSSYKYFLDVDGKIVKKSNSFKTIEEEYVKECEKKHSDGHGRIIIGKQKLEDGIATNLT